MKELINKQRQQKSFGMLWLDIGDKDPSKTDISTDIRNTLCFERITMKHKACLDKRKAAGLLHFLVNSKFSESMVKEKACGWVLFSQDPYIPLLVQSQWFEVLKSPKGNTWAHAHLLSIGDEFWSLWLHCWTQSSHFCQCSTGRKGGQDVCCHKLSTWSEQHHEAPPSEAQIAQGHPLQGVPSLQYDMGLCLQSHFQRFWGFFLADSPQRIKLQKRDNQRRTRLPQNLRGTKTRCLHFQRPKQMGQEVSQYYKRGLSPLSDWRSMSGIWYIFVQASKYCENKSEENWGLPAHCNFNVSPCTWGKTHVFLEWDPPR